MALRSRVAGLLQNTAALYILLLTAVAGVGLLVYETGGIAYVFSHTAYVPIVLAGIYLRRYGVVIIALAAGLILGPYMPIHTDTMQMQSTLNWVYRTLYFVLIGFLIAYFSSRRQTAEMEQRRVLEQLVDERTKELVQSNNDLERFAYAASHDLKAPLRAIMNLSSYIEEEDGQNLSASGVKDIGQIKLRAARMSALIDGLLNYSRIGHSKEKIETIDVEEIIRDLRDIAEIPETVSISVSGKLENFTSYKVPLEQVLGNLLSNAIRHNDRDGAEVAIELEDRGDKVLISVSDNGPGIRIEDHDKIFESFTRLDDSERKGGVGMGLAIVKRQVEELGGTTEVFSDPRHYRGTRFQFTWPKLMVKSAAVAGGEPSLKTVGSR